MTDPITPATLAERTAECLIALYGAAVSKGSWQVQRGAHPGDVLSLEFTTTIEAVLAVATEAQATALREAAASLEMKTAGFGYEKSQRIGQKAFALADWFKERGERPDVWMDLFSEIICSDKPLTERDIARTQELAAKYGWK